MLQQMLPEMGKDKNREKEVIAQFQISYELKIITL